MEKREHYRRNLPHYQQPGQEYFITKSLKDAIPPKALKRYTADLEIVRDKIKHLQSDETKIDQLVALKMEYGLLRKKYLKAYDDLLALKHKAKIDLSRPANRQIMFNAFRYYEGKRLENYAFCVMSNHYNWVVRLYEKDENGKPVYLQDILKVVNGFSAHEINRLENKTGRKVWQDENFETTIRDHRHSYNAILYTINNPVKAGLVEHWQDWAGTWSAFDL